MSVKELIEQAIGFIIGIIMPISGFLGLSYLVYFVRKNKTTIQKNKVEVEADNSGEVIGGNKTTGDTIIDKSTNITYNLSSEKQNSKKEISKKSKKETKTKETSNIKRGKDFFDDRNGRTYKTVIINNKTWLAEDLNYTPNSTRLFEERPRNTYNWEGAMKVCPSGWHLPSKDEWLELIEFAGGSANAGKKLKAKKGWLDSDIVNCNGTDDFGFAALPYGRIDNRNNCGWWSSTERDSDAFVVIIESDDSIETRYEGKKGSIYKFVRCIKD